MNVVLGSDTYTLDVFPLPATAETNPMPLDLVVSGGKVWLGCEFDRRIYSLPTTATNGTVMTAHEIPAPAEPIFWAGVFGGMPSHMSQVEDIDADAAGNIWLTQRGSAPYAGDALNASRLMRYTPSTGAWRAWALPHNNAGCGGLLVDAQRVWATCGETSVGGALCVTRPLSWWPDHTDPANLDGRWADDELAGWRTIPHAQSWPAHMAIGADGRIYVTNYFGASVTAYGRTTLAAQVYPLPAGSERPWQVFTDLGGGVWVTCDATRQLAKLNPAAGTWTVYPLGLPTTDFLHSAALVSGAVWFTAYSTGAGGRIGRRNASGTVDLSPPLSDLGFEKGAAGIAANGSEIWVALFGSKAVGRLVKL